MAQQKLQMKQFYPFIKDYFLNGAWAYSVFALYAVTIAPLMADFADFGNPHIAVGIFGFIMLILEFPALRYKLKMIRIRTNIKRQEYKKATGTDVVPSVSPGVLFSFFARIVFHMGIVMVSLTSLGIPATESYMSTPGLIIVIAVFVADVAGLIYLYFNFDIYTDDPQTKKELREDLNEEETWMSKYAVNLNPENARQKELLADLVLQIYCCMLFTAFWKMINQRAIETLFDCLKDKEGAGMAAFELIPILVVTIAVALRPMQPAYWIENSLQAFTINEKRRTWMIFGILGVFVFIPTISKYYQIFISNDLSSNSAFPEYVRYIFPFILFLLILGIDLFAYSRLQKQLVSQPVTEIQTPE
jgi:hypothetical protein